MEHALLDQDDGEDRAAFQRYCLRKGCYQGRTVDTVFHLEMLL